MAKKQTYEQLLSIEPQTKCLLCLVGNPTEKGHFHPRLVSRYVAKVTKTPFRFSENPHSRQQDTVKIEMLCPDCEDVFGRYEWAFARQILRPYFKYESGVRSYPYGSEFYDFLLSIVWRALALSSLTPDHSKWPRVLHEMFEHWRLALAAQTPSVEPIIFAAMECDIADAQIKRHPFLTRLALKYCILQDIYLIRSVGSGEYGGACVYVQLGPIHIFGWDQSTGETKHGPLADFRIRREPAHLNARGELPTDMFQQLFGAQWRGTQKFQAAGIFSA